MAKSLSDPSPRWTWVNFTVRPHPDYYPALPEGATLRDGSTVGGRMQLYVPRRGSTEAALEQAKHIAMQAYGILAENPRIGRIRD